MRLVLLHPDLGLGGAERLVVDIAMAAVSKVRADSPGFREVARHGRREASHGSLAPCPPPFPAPRQGHSVSMWTSHYEPERAFAETRTGAFDIQVHGDWIPRQLFGALHILFALARNTWLAVAAAFLAGPVDVFICDQVSICVPILRMLRPDARVLFYCHHPDLLLTSRKSILKRLYRLPFDVLEELTTLLSDRIVVNSKYTARVFQETFSLARATNVKPDVLYPCITLPALRGAASLCVRRLPRPGSRQPCPRASCEGHAIRRAAHTPPAHPPRHVSPAPPPHAACRRPRPLLSSSPSTATSARRASTWPSASLPISGPQRVLHSCAASS